MKIDRKEFLKKAGLGTIALGSLPSLVGTLATPARAQGGMNFHLVAVSAASPQHLLAFFGQGHFDPARMGSRVEGGGGFFHFTPGTPTAQLVASGTWKPRLLVSYMQLGTYGVAASGVLQVVVDVFRQVPSPAVIHGATLKVVCNIEPAGLMNPGELEGYTLSLPGTDFDTGGTPGPFRPIPSPPPANVVGFSIFTTVPTM